MLTDSRFYLSGDFKSFHLGSKEEAQQKGWVSMAKGIEEYGHDKWLKILLSQVSFTEEEYHNYTLEQAWPLFQKKILVPL